MCHNYDGIMGWFLVDVEETKDKKKCCLNLWHWVYVSHCPLMFTVDMRMFLPPPPFLCPCKRTISSLLIMFSFCNSLKNTPDTCGPQLVVNRRAGMEGLKALQWASLSTLSLAAYWNYSTIPYFSIWTK